MTAVFRQTREMLGASRHKSKSPLHLPVWGCPHSLAIPKTRVAGWNRDGRALVAISYIVDDWKEQRRRRIGQLNTEVDLGQAILRDAACLCQTSNQRTRCIVVNWQDLRVTRYMSSSHETAILAGACFWGMQDLLRRYPGVISTRVGYTGGDVPNATYRNHGTHAAALEVVFDPQKLSYRKLLEFFQIHDPTTLNRQGNDLGTSYRSAIFYSTDTVLQCCGAAYGRCSCPQQRRDWPFAMLLSALEKSKGYLAGPCQNERLEVRCS